VRKCRLRHEEEVAWISLVRFVIRNSEADRFIVLVENIMNEISNYITIDTSNRLENQPNSIGRSLKRFHRFS